MNALTVSPDGELIVTGAEDNKVRIWDVSSPAKPQLLGELGHHDSPVRLVLIQQHGERLTAVGDERGVIVWNEEGDLIEEWHFLKRAQCVYALTLDGRYLATGGGDSDVHLYRVAARRPQPTEP